jgi:MFS family permease
VTGSVSRRRAPFAALLSAYAVSVLGTTMSELAIPWFVLTTTGSAAKTGLVAFAEMAPYVLAQVLAGPIVDRAGLRRSFVAGNIAAALAVGAIPVMYAAGSLSFGVLLALVAVAGSVRGAADCANSALVPATATVGHIPLERAAGLNSGANRTALLLGAPLGGVLITLTSSTTVVAADAATFAVAAVVVAVFVRGIRPGTTVPHQSPPVDATRPTGSAIRRYGRDLAEGLRFIRGDRLLLGIVTMVAVANLLDQGMSAVLLPVWVRRELHSATALGLLGGALGLGALIGSLAGAWLGPRVPRRALYGFGFLLGAAPRFFVLLLASSLAPVLVVFFVADTFGGSVNSVIGATSYERIPPHLQARVLGMIKASAYVGIPFGALVAGFAADAVGLDTTIAVAGVCYLVTTLTPFVFPAWRDMRRPADAALDARSAAPTTADATPIADATPTTAADSTPSAVVSTHDRVGGSLPLPDPPTRS